MGPWSDYHLNIYLNLSGTATSTLIINWPIFAWNCPDTKRTLLGITDGTSNTIFAGHGYMDRGVYAATTWAPGGANFTSVGNYSGPIWVGGTSSTARGGSNVNNIAWNVSNTMTGSYTTPGTVGTGPGTGLRRDDTNYILTGNHYSGANNLPWGGPFPVGALFVWCDGTVRQVPYATVTTQQVTNTFGSYLTPTGGEAATLPD
jgi:hypothetical protein